MAKAKSKKITVEDALVPVDEQPYEVPENWCWTTLDQVCFFENGYAFKSDKFSDNGIPVIRISNIFDNEVSIEGCVYTTEENIDDRFIIKNGDLLIAMSGATTGKNGVFLSYQKAYLNQRVGNIKVINHNVLLEGFRNYYIASKQEEILRNAYGGAQPNISSTKIGKMPFPLPPLPEQQRIVKQIESLFSKLDEAKEKAELSLEGFDKRKESILFKAFRGELTEKYRKLMNPISATEYLNKLVAEGKTFSRKDFSFWENSELPSGWVESKIGNLLYFAGRIGWKGLKAEEYTEEGPLFLSVYNLNDGDEVTYNRVYHITKERYEESPEIMVQVGDVLLTKDGAGIGKLGYVKELPQKATINSSLLLIRPGEVADPKYVFYLLSGPELQGIVRERITGSATPHLFQRDIKEFIIPIPPMEEQKEIVSILDDILSKEYQAYDAAKMLVDQVELMKKAILAKAFRGELGTNDSSEGNSMEMLKTIIEE